MSKKEGWIPPPSTAAIVAALKLQIADEVARQLAVAGVGRCVEWIYSGSPDVGIYRCIHVRGHEGEHLYAQEKRR